MEVNAEYLFEFESENHWITCAKRWCSMYKGHQLLFINKNNDYVDRGEDFRIAQELGLYPIKVYRLIRTREVFLKQHKTNNT